MSVEVWVQKRHVDGLYGVVMGEVELSSFPLIGAELVAELVGRPVMACVDEDDRKGEQEHVMTNTRDKRVGKERDESIDRDR
jgi:hypothetical protein